MRSLLGGVCVCVCVSFSGGEGRNGNPSERYNVAPTGLQTGRSSYWSLHPQPWIESKCSM